MKKLINKLAHACGLYTAADVEHIEKHWQGKIDRLQSLPVKLSMGAGGGGKGGHGHTPSWYSRANEPVFIPSTPAQGQTLIIKPDKLLDNPSAPAGQLPLHKGALRLTGPERRELAHEAARWCKQQNIEASPENIIFYLDDRRMISAPTQ